MLIHNKAMFAQKFIIILLITIWVVPLSWVHGQSIAVETIDLPQSVCSGRFVAHELSHTTTSWREPIRTFESNGAGVAVNDLDGNGYLDLVFANLDQSATLLLNHGEREFHKVVLHTRAPTRAVSIIDVDGNAHLDIVFTTQLGGLIIWWNTGVLDTSSDVALTFDPLPGANRQAYSMAWGDVDHDGDLDLVTASYDAELSMLLRDSFLFGNGAGVFYYEHVAGTFVPTRLASQAQGLVTYLHDLDDDGRWELMVGNDFGVPDQFWSHHDGEWQSITPFDTITHSTMSAQAADLNNDGRDELFTTDMKPYENTPDVAAMWQPIFDSMSPMPDGDPQVMENLLQVPSPSGYENGGRVWGIDATGWSWSSQFGDLDNDGFQDLYVTNGMIAADLFGHLPGHELVEENQVFRNQAGERFIPQTDWALNTTLSGRGMVMADLDNDGDLDIAVNNLLSPSVLYENQLCGRSVQIDIRWPGSENTHALGTRAALYTDTAIYYRDVEATSGYLSGNSSRLHFGMPESETIQYLELEWLDGLVTRIDLAEHPLSTLVTITRT